MSRKNILIVDRDKDFLIELREAFVPFKSSYQVAFAFNVSKANEILKKFTVHLVLANVYLSGESGIELLLSVRRWYADTHVVLYSADLSEELKRSAYHNGAAAVLDHPFKMDDLLRLLRGIFAKETGDVFLDSIPLVDLLQLIGMGNHSTDIMVIDVNLRRGIIRIRQGNLVEAEATDKKGVDAITEMLSWKTPKIKTCNNSIGIILPSRALSLHDALIQAVGRLDEQY